MLPAWGDRSFHVNSTNVCNKCATITQIMLRQMKTMCCCRFLFPLSLTRAQQGEQEHCDRKLLQLRSWKWFTAPANIFCSQASSNLLTLGYRAISYARCQKMSGRYFAIAYNQCFNATGMCWILLSFVDFKSVWINNKFHATALNTRNNNNLTFEDNRICEIIRVCCLYALCFFSSVAQMVFFFFLLSFLWQTLQWNGESRVLV